MRSLAGKRRSGAVTSFSFSNPAMAINASPARIAKLRLRSTSSAYKPPLSVGRASHKDVKVRPIQADSGLVSSCQVLSGLGLQGGNEFGDKFIHPEHLFAALDHHDVAAPEQAG